MADTVAGDDDLDDWGLEIFDDFPSAIGGERFPGVGGLADSERFPELFSDPGRSLVAPST